jgi:hypothetical protein
MTQRAIVLVRTTRPVGEMVPVLASMRGIVRVDRVQGPYHLVIHTIVVDEVGAIRQLPGVTHAEVCWLSPDPEGGSK